MKRLFGPRLVLDRLPKTTFVIVGQDDKGDVQRLQALCRELGIERKHSLAGCS